MILTQKIKKIVDEAPEIKKWLPLDLNDYLVAYKFLSIKNNNNLLNKGIRLYRNKENQLCLLYENNYYQNHNFSFRNIFEHSFSIKKIFLKDYICQTKEQKRVLKRIQKIIKEKKNTQFSKGLYLYGPSHGGKTFLLSVLFNELKKTEDVFFAFLPDLSREIKYKAFNPEYNLEEKINFLKKIPFLILDDIGNENISSWFRDEVLIPILNYRMNAKLNTFFSSNYNLEELSLKMTENEIIKNREQDKNKEHRNYYSNKGIRLLTRIIHNSDTFFISNDEEKNLNKEFNKND